MNGLLVPRQLMPGSAVQAGVSLNVFVTLLILVSACAATATPVSGTRGVASVILDGLFQNKVLWLCLGVALWHLCRHRSPTIGCPQILASVPALIFAALAGGLLSWIGLSLSLMLMLLTTRGWGDARVGVLIALAASLHKIFVVFSGELVGDGLLQLEAQLAGFLASGIIPELQVEGNSLQTSGGHMVLLVWGCSSLSNLGDVLLLFWVLVSVRWSGSSLQSNRGRIIGYMGLLTCATIALNILRLVLMAIDLEIYTYLHGREGSAWFRTATLGLTVLMGNLVSRRE